jgi:P-type E1-E2 ATPase
MLCIDIPGNTRLTLEHLVLDYNGTLALDGTLLPGVVPALRELSKQLAVHVLTADTFECAAHELQGLPLTLSIVPAEKQDEHKKNYVEVLGAERCACIGNGRNDCLMLSCAAVGIAVMQQECAAAAAFRCADIIAPDIFSALGLLQNPLRMQATLRL